VTDSGLLNATGCTACPANIYTTGSAAGSASVSACTICAPGTAGTVTGSGTVGAAGCTTCAAGTYSAANSATCTSCPAGISTTGAASVTVSECTICAPGFAGAVTGSGTVAAAGCSSCPANTFSYSGSVCAYCTFGATFLSSNLGCSPSATLASGPTDTAFYLSGDQTEGVTAFQSVTAPLGVSFSSAAVPLGVTGSPSSALILASGSYLTASGASAPQVRVCQRSGCWSYRAFNSMGSMTLGPRPAPCST
jgi:hypothetical protein